MAMIELNKSFVQCPHASVVRVNPKMSYITSQIVTNQSGRKRRSASVVISLVTPKWVHSYIPLYDVLVVFGAVSVAPHSGGHVLVYVQVASPLVQAASTQS